MSKTKENFYKACEEGICCLNCETPIGLGEYTLATILCESQKLAWWHCKNGEHSYMATVKDMGEKGGTESLCYICNPETVKKPDLYERLGIDECEMGLEPDCGTNYCSIGCLEDHTGAKIK